MNPSMKSNLIASRIRQAIALMALFPLVFCEAAGWTQQSQPAQQPQQTQPQTQPNQQQQDQSAPDAGGPTGDNGAIAIPKKKEKDEAPPPPPEPKVKNPEGLQNFSLRVDASVVNVDVGVILEKTHQFVPNLQKENFRVYEDGNAQEISSFQRIQAPITAVLLVEFAANSYAFIYDMRNAAYTFAQQLKADDYIAVVTYDMHTEILTDFTQDKRLIYQSLNSLTIPTWHETNLFDALYQTLDRLSRVEGRKYVVLISSGRDTFSKINLDKVMQKIKATPNVTIFSIGTGQTARIMADGAGMMGPIRNLDYLQADNQMTTFARMTGGMSFFPRFAGEMPDIFHQINESIRNQYVLSYHPTNVKQDGTYRKLRVELVDNEGHPLRMQDEKHKPLKYDIIARDGYRAKQEVE
ncbi:VWA domain-containing protein [Acidobacterium sp. S8]|uniref:VWA domain-containing protein n=1 Tax=Acidobacterium sp. S8 TaxID=1641854 RepID=UPI0020B16092|nr:VWA domain-containing protein [Acidobacterium sp. S8]